MRLEIQIFDDNEQVVAEYRGDPSQPGAWRAQPGQRLISTMPQQSDNKNTGTYELFGFTYQPHLRVDRPNGYTSPVPGPNNGLPSNFPTGLLGGTLGQKSNNGPYFQSRGIPVSTWNPSVPTAAPAPSANSIQGTNQ